MAFSLCTTNNKIKDEGILEEKSASRILTVWNVNVVQVETNQVETNRLVSTLAWLVSTQCGNQPEKGGNRPAGFHLLPGWFPP